MPSRFLNNITVNDSYTLPSADGDADQIIQTDGAGNLSFVDLSSIEGAASNFVYFEVKNETGSPINKGKGVMAVGIDGNSGHILIDEMIADGSVEPKYFLGVLETTVANGGFARVISFGQLDQFDTRGQNGETWLDGQILWCDPDSAGDFTITEPDGPNVKIAAAFILNSSTNGKIQVRVQANEGIHDLHDTKITSQVDGDVLVWDDTTGVWFNDSTLNVDYTAGNVGIGTTSPGVTLQVGDGTTDTTSRFYHDDNAYTEVNGYGLYFSRNTSYIRPVTNNNQAMVFGSSSRSWGSIEFDATTVTFDNNGSEAMRIDSSGNVGIGTTNPNTALEVDGAISTTTSDYTQGSTGSRLLLETSGSGNTHSYIQAQSSGGTSNAEDLALQLYGGNVGIGTSSPTSQLGSVKVLDISSTGNNEIILDHTDAGANSDIGLYSWNRNNDHLAHIKATCDKTTDSAFISFHAQPIGGSFSSPSSNEKMRISSNGNVGIGINGPRAKLHVFGTASSMPALGTGASAAQIGGNAFGTLFSTLTSGRGVIQQGRSDGTPTSYDLLLQPVGGNVGIGTTSPQAKLHVANGTLRTWTPTTGTSAIFESTVSNRNFVTLTAANEAELWFGDAATQTKGRVRYEMAGNNMEFWTNATQKMVINGSGNVGIGTTNPTSAKLVVAGDVDVWNSTNTLLRSSHNGSYGSFQTFTGGLYGILSLNPGGGNVGIGTTSPAEKLEVNGYVKASSGYKGYLPAFQHGGFYHSSSSSSSTVYWIPTNNITETTSSQYYNNWVAPYSGRVKKIVMRWASGTTPTATSVTFRKSINGGGDLNTYPATIANAASTNMTATRVFGSTDIAFNEGDRVRIGFTTDGGTRLLYGFAYTIVLEYNKD